MGVKISELTEAMAAQNSDEMPIVQNGETKKITVETLMSNLQTQLTNLQNQVNNKNIITAGASSSVTVTTTGETKIPITTAVVKVGSAFTISNNKVVVGSGVNHVLVSAQIYCNLAANRGEPFNFFVRKNGTNVTGQVNGGYASTSTRNACLSLPPKLIAVTEGDYFEYYSYNYVDDVIRSDATSNTYLTIEAID